MLRHTRRINSARARTDRSHAPRRGLELHEATSATRRATTAHRIVVVVVLRLDDEVPPLAATTTTNQKTNTDPAAAAPVRTVAEVAEPAPRQLSL